MNTSPHIKNSIKIKKIDSFTVKPLYTVREMKNILGYKTMSGARRFLFKLNLPIHLVGGKYIIYLSEMQNHAPELYASILEAANLNFLIQKQKEEADELSTPNQFR